jgi:hypothetical protein
MQLKFESMHMWLCVVSSIGSTASNTRSVYLDTKQRQRFHAERSIRFN